MANNNNAPWGATQNGTEENGIQYRPMTLKVTYAFDEDNRLGRWPQTLHIQSMPLDERTVIGIVDLKTCLQTVALHSPELAGDSERDYTIYAYDYSEPEIPLVGQGMLSWALEQNSDLSAPSLVTGLVTENRLAIFGNGVRETLEVKLKLTAVPRIARANTVPASNSRMDSATPTFNSASTMSENAEWASLVQSNPNLGRQGNVSALSSPALAPVRPFHPNYDGRHENSTMSPRMQPQTVSAPTAPSSRPASAASNTQGNGSFMQAAPSPFAASGNQPGPEEPIPTPPASNTTNRAQSRPASRQSKKATGKPRGRPRKKPAPVEGSTSDYEDGTDADDGPQKKRAKTTTVARSNTATFLSAPESLRVAASTAGSLRNFRPVGPGGDAPGGSHLQEVPRAPTPVPDRRLPAQPQTRQPAPSGLRRLSMSGQDQNGSFTTSYMELNRSVSQNLDVQSPLDLVAASPSQYSDASPADIGSSPPVPRAMYSVRSSPAPSSPLLPPLPAPQPDSGFMSGGFEDIAPLDETMHAQGPPRPAPLVPRKPKAPKKPRPSRAKKPTQSKNLIMQTETPGPPELLPTTVLYNPPASRRASEQPPTPAANNQPNYPEMSPAEQPTPHPPTRSVSQMAPTEHPSHPTLTRSVSEVAPVEQYGRPHLKRSVTEMATTEQSSHLPLVRSVSELVPLEQSAFAPVKRAASEVTITEPNMQQTPTLIAEPNDETPQETNMDDKSDFERRLLRCLNEEGFRSQMVDMDMSRNTQLDMQTDSQMQTRTNVETHVPLDIQMTSQTYMTIDNQQAQVNGVKPTTEPMDPPMDPPPAPRVSEESAAEPEISPPSVAIPAGDPVGPRLTLPNIVSEPSHPLMSEPSHPPTDFPNPWDEYSAEFNKNYVKKQAIKQKLDDAVAKGQLPPFCTNCGAIQTPTWRKIWKQEHEGVPEYHEYSEKPGHVTAINVLERNETGRPTRYELIKKTLGQHENRTHWKEILLCNPCGIWFSKWKSQRPQEKWEKDQDRLTQTRKKRTTGGASRSRKSRTKSGSQTNLTSEIGLPTDPLGPSEIGFSPKNEIADPFNFLHHQADGPNGSGANLQGPGSTHSRGSVHSRGTGTPTSPIAVDDDELGDTRRLLFPSPRKDGVQKVLGEVAVNIVQTSPEFRASKETQVAADKENVQTHDDDMNELFGSPPPRPSTPPPKAANSGPFKTPTRQTPNHRPITRSVTKSIRSTRSPGQAASRLQHTPSKTPRSNMLSSSAIRRAAVPPHLLDDNIFESPFTKSINQLLSEANDFMAPSPSHGYSMELEDLPHMDSDGNLVEGGHINFGKLLSIDLGEPSSPTILRDGLENGYTFGEEMTLVDANADLLKHLGQFGAAENAGEDRK